MSASVIGLFAAGLVALLLGAELLVRGAARLAAAAGISPLVIGLTVVAWGTGSPELAVGMKAALQGQPDITIGNVVGSNIANILLILGVAALVVPLKVSLRVVRLDVPIMVGVSALTFVAALGGRISRLEGLVFVALLLFYTAWTIRESRREHRASVEQRERELGDEAEPPRARRHLFAGFGAMILGGLYLLVKGSEWLVQGATAIAEAFGLSQLVIGLTIIAIGTSLPELATSAVAGARGERDIAVGNAVGSNIFNLLAVLGFTALLAPDGIPVAPAAISLDIPIMIAVAMACLPVFFVGYVIDRWNGALFLALYAGYLTYLVLDGTRHAALSGFSWVMLAFVLPLVAFTLGITLFQELKSRPTRNDSR